LIYQEQTYLIKDIDHSQECQLLEGVLLQKQLTASKKNLL
jgi:hypothetical protein